VQLERPREQVSALRRRHRAHVERIDDVDVVLVHVDRPAERVLEDSERCAPRLRVAVA
jgi:hypothetical protein